MGENNLRIIEKKVLGAMLIHADESMVVRASRRELVDTMGYKSTGGAITFALQALEMKNFISTHDEGYQVLI